MLFAGECVLEQRTELALGKLVFLSILFIAHLGTKTFSDLTVLALNYVKIISQLFWLIFYMYHIMLKQWVDHSSVVHHLPGMLETLNSFPSRLMSG